MRVTIISKKNNRKKDVAIVDKVFNFKILHIPIAK